MTRKRKRSGRRPRRPVRAPDPAYGCPEWLSIDGRLMFVVGYTPGGSPFGVFDDEMGDFVAGDGSGGEPPFSRADRGVPFPGSETASGRD